MAKALLPMRGSIEDSEASAFLYDSSDGKQPVGEFGRAGGVIGGAALGSGLDGKAGAVFTGAELRSAGAVRGDTVLRAAAAAPASRGVFDLLVEPCIEAACAAAGVVASGNAAGVAGAGSSLGGGIGAGGWLITERKGSSNISDASFSPPFWSRILWRKSSSRQDSSASNCKYLRTHNVSTGFHGSGR